MQYTLKISKQAERNIFARFVGAKEDTGWAWRKAIPQILFCGLEALLVMRPIWEMFLKTDSWLLYPRVFAFSGAGSGTLIFFFFLNKILLVSSTSQG